MDCKPCKKYISNLKLRDGLYLEPIWSKTLNGNTHIFYQLHYFGIPVWNSGIVFHLQKDTLLIDPILPNLSSLPSPFTDNILNTDLRYILLGKEWKLAVAKYVFNPNTGYALMEFRDLQGNRIRSENVLRYQGHQKVEAYVFNPNPTHSSSTSYGSIFTDRNDAMYPELLDEMKLIQIQRGLPAYIQLSDRSPPTYSTYIPQIDHLPADRSDPLFECVQVLYHIDRFVEWIRKIGFRDSIQLIQVDPHALAGADQSVFDPFATPPSIQFGVGGVDDAEDAQVIIHEFCHALIHQLTPHSYHGTARKSIEEAIADYFALSYSHRLNGNLSRKVFSWDAHNPFWEGYTARENFIVCPTDDEHCLRESWSGIFLEFARIVGFETVDRILLNFLPLLIPNGSTTEHAGRLIWLYKQLGLERSGKLTELLRSCGFLDLNSPITTIIETSAVRILKGSECRLELQDIHYIQWDLIDQSGKLVKSGTGIGSVIQIPSEHFGGIGALFWLAVEGIEQEGSRPVRRVLRVLYLP